MALTGLLRGVGGIGVGLHGRLSRGDRGVGSNAQGVHRGERDLAEHRRRDRTAVGVPGPVDDDGHGDGRIARRRETDEGGDRAVLGEDLGGAGLACDEVAVASFFYNSCRCS